MLLNKVEVTVGAVDEVAAVLVGSVEEVAAGVVS